MGFNDDAQSASGNFNLQEVYENKREEHLKLMQDKEDEMRQVCIASIFVLESGVIAWTVKILYLKASSFVSV